jgi:PIN domain nuclease of toxin-antitoxin system
LNPRLLLDTHIVIRWLSDPKKLSREQRRVLDGAVRCGECVGVSAISLHEIALLAQGLKRIGAGLDELFHEMDTNPAFRIIPFTTSVAREVAAMGDALRDPSDRAIVATARVHRLTLLTADQRIIESNLVPVVE